jgi:transglycosylase-like protein
VLTTGFAALALAVPASAAHSGYSQEWLVQARCVHVREGAWTANTGNGYFGGMQFSARTWKRVGGKPDPAFTHPGNAAYPFTASAQEQLYRAWLLWKHDGGSWRSWGAVGAACS